MKQQILKILLILFILISIIMFAVSSVIILRGRTASAKVDVIDKKLDDIKRFGETFEQQKVSDAFGCNYRGRHYTSQYDIFKGEPYLIGDTHKI